jgi:hypothetical protein
LVALALLAVRRCPAADSITYRCETAIEFSVALLDRAARVHGRGAGKKDVHRKAAGLA